MSISRITKKYERLAIRTRKKRKKRKMPLPKKGLTCTFSQKGGRETVSGVCSNVVPWRAGKAQIHLENGRKFEADDGGWYDITKTKQDPNAKPYSLSWS